MNYYQEALFLVFFVIASLIVLDANVGAYFLLKLKLLSINIRRAYWMMRLHPRNPIANYLMDRRHNKFIKELKKDECDS